MKGLLPTLSKQVAKLFNPKSIERAFVFSKFKSVVSFSYTISILNVFACGTIK
jgi:hypothetical protein